MNFSSCEKTPHYRINHRRGSAVTITAERAAELMAFLENFAGGKLVPSFALSLFAGIRPCVRFGEIAKLKRESVRLDTGVIRIEPDVSKVRMPRNVTIQPNLAAWLHAYHQLIPSQMGEINRLHDVVVRCTAESRTALDAALTAAWQAGRLLLAEHDRISRMLLKGGWSRLVRKNFKGSLRTGSGLRPSRRRRGNTPFPRCRITSAWRRGWFPPFGGDCPAARTPRHLPSPTVANIAKWVESINHLRQQIDSLNRMINIQSDVRRWTGNPVDAGTKVVLEGLGGPVKAIDDLA